MDTSGEQRDPSEVLDDPSLMMRGLDMFLGDDLEKVHDYYEAMKNPYLAVYNRLELSKTMNTLTHELRQLFTTYYAFAVPDKEAIMLIDEFSPNGVVEIGAGTGYWARMLKMIGGVDVVCYDDYSWDHIEHGRFHTVIKANHQLIAAAHPERSLMLCWPPYRSPMANETLRAYTGQTLIYIGEGRHGCTADDGFFDQLEQEWDLIAELDIPQWADIHDTLQIYTRRQTNAG